MRNRLRHSLWFCFALSCLLFAGISRGADSAPAYPPGVGAFCQPLDADDHLEGFNRSVHLFNQGLVSYVFYPIGVGYNFLVPEIARTGIANCSHNLLFPLRLVNTCLQGKFQAAWEETKRFGVNSTIGVLGFRDQASRWDMPSHDEDFGQTMGHYGLKPGFFINLPFLGPSSGRDLLGRLLDTPFNLTFWLFNSDTATAVNAATYTNTALSTAPTLKQVFDSQDDTYRISQALYLLDRETKVRDFPLTEVDGAPDESFGFLALKPSSTTFFQRGTTRNLKLPGAWQKLPYSFWKAKADTTKMLVILPGVGSHRLSTGVLALAELMQTNGWNVITLSSTLHPDFFLGLPGNDLPGDFRRDAEAIRLVLTHALADFSQLYPKQAPSSISVLGYSLGAINALFLAAQEGGADSGQPPVDRYVAINPPVDPIHALQQIDQFFDIPKNWLNPEQRAEDIFMRLNTAMQAHKRQQPGSQPRPLPITREESQFLIGFNLRLALADAICASQKRHNLGLLRRDPDVFRRNAVHTEALGISYMTYAQDYILPQARQQLRQDAMTASELAEGLSLRAIADCLKNNHRITVLHNRNDFLLADNDLDWLASKLGDRLQVFPAGGHLGNLYLTEYKTLLTTLLP
ncbi:MAG TPA: VacJ family lipoprotein [Lentisphaeria bacterium]|nr:VacJ family lipoprotein [Lentisphaeria bacterium]